MNGNLALSFVNYFENIKYGSFAVAKHFKHGGNFYTGFNYIDYGKMDRTDATGRVYGTFGAHETCVNLAYAHPVLDSGFSIGVNLKTIYSNMDVYTSNGMALDFGATYCHPKNNFTVAAVAKNVGKIWNAYKDGHNEKLPFEVQIGVSMRSRLFPVRVSLIYENLEKWDLMYHDPSAPYPRDPTTGELMEENKTKVFGDRLMRHIVVGTEFIITKNLFLRVGYNYQRMVELNNPSRNEFSGFSFGFGFRVYKFHFSYGRAVYNLAGATNNFSMCFDLNSFFRK